MLLLSINLLAALVIFIKGLFFVVNSMDRRTSHVVRLAWVVMTTVALCVLLDPLYGNWRCPNLRETVLLVGLAIYVGFERRRPCALRGMP